jgi:hypothetical protein
MTKSIYLPRKPIYPALPMTDDFSILFELLEYERAEVAGHASSTISRDIRENLAKLAAGQCNDKERRDLLRVLNEQPEFISELVREIKRLRGLAR